MSLDIEILKIRQGEVQRFSRLLDLAFDFGFWGFQESYLHFYPYHSAYIIYDSEWCRVKFDINSGDLLRGYGMRVRYGRKHAPNTVSTMLWNGEECWCWHEIPEALMFLDGFSPQETVDEYRAKGRWGFMEAEITQKTNSRLESDAKIHALIWKKYGRRLFELFDLRHSELWNQYVSFFAKYQKLSGSMAIHSDSPVPDKDRIC